MSPHNNIRYVYRRRLDNWAVYQIARTASGVETESKVGSFRDKAQAEQEVYRLNGWKLKNNDHDSKLV